MGLGGLGWFGADGGWGVGRVGGGVVVRVGVRGAGNGALLGLGGVGWEVWEVVEGGGQGLKGWVWG